MEGAWLCGIPEGQAGPRREREGHTPGSPVHVITGTRIHGLRAEAAGQPASSALHTPVLLP